MSNQGRLNTVIISKEDNILSEGFLKKYFDMKDLNGDGQLDLKEVRKLLTTIFEAKHKELKNVNIDMFMSKFDANNDNKVSFQEFVKAINKIKI